MHKGIVILVKAEHRDEAVEKVKGFLEPYGDGNVWDWYQIGGRWTGMLAPMSKEFDAWARAFCLEKQTESGSENPHGFIYDRTTKTYSSELQSKWEELGGRGMNPFGDHYRLPEDGAPFDAVPLADCIEIVRDYRRDPDKEAEENWKRMIEERRKERIQVKKKAPYVSTSSAYYAGLYKNARYREFCFDINVYDVNYGEAEHIPEDTTGVWAVMVDIHN